MGQACSTDAAVNTANAPGNFQVVFVRHGQSTWNLENKFTGWVDVPLTDRGLAEATEAGNVLKEQGFNFDIAYCSVLQRAIKTCNVILESMDQEFIPQVKDYRLNERMYGALAGLDKKETVEKHGKEQVHIWRRSYDVPPPPADDDHPYFPGGERKYAHLPADAIPRSESLKTTLERVLPCWNDVIVPDVKAGRTVLVAAHGNSIRAILKHLDDIPEDVITGINIPTGVPLLYEFDKDMTPLKLDGAAENLSGRYLIDEATVKAKIEEVANQTKT